MLYHWFEAGHAAFGPARLAADTCRALLGNPFNPIAHTAVGRGAHAACELFERTTRRYARRPFGITATTVGGRRVAVAEDVVWRAPFCRLLHFRRSIETAATGDAPRILLVAPMSGHFATLLRGTVEALLPHADVYVTDWQDARLVPLSAGPFGLDDYIDTMQTLFRMFHGDVHVVAVCQPSVPVLAAVSLMEAAGDPDVPRSMVLMGGPVDTRANPTEVNHLAERKGIEWFRRSVIASVPWPNPAQGREVYPGFLQLTGFMTMNLDRHVKAHKDLFIHLVRGDGDSADKHKEFYDEYLAVMDLAAEFYLDTVENVFIRHALPKGELRHRGQAVDPGKIRRTALMTIEGEKDDITGPGQCASAHRLCSALADDRREHYLQPGVGHYGVFNGSRFRNEILPRMLGFIATHDRLREPTKRAAASRVSGGGTAAQRKSRPA